jgi:exodeoxyribonuclease VII large subunit
MDETITVTQLNTRVRGILGGSKEVNDLWVAGEVSNFKRYASGHSYFTLKDAGSEIRCVLFRGDSSRLGFELSDNLEVALFGSVDIYVERGAYQFIARTARKGGRGDLYVRLEELKARLRAEGLFEESRKRPLPAYPRTVGIVTSPSGAAIHDMVVTAGRRFPADILLAPAKVQGEGAAESVAAGIALLNRAGADVIIVGRGGGSIEDLWAFNEEVTVRAIAASAAPVVSAVGHESDFTLADLVADVRAATPTAAAETVLADRRDLSRRVDALLVRAGSAVERVTLMMRSRFSRADTALSPRRAADLVAMRMLEADRLSDRLDAVLRNRAGRMRGRYETASAMLDRAARDLTVPRRNRLEAAAGRLEALSPYEVLGRGYGMVADAQGRTVTSAAAVKEGMVIAVRMRDGRIAAEVKEVELI